MMDLQTFLSNIITFLNETIVPFILAGAFLMFLWNITRYFIIGGANEKEHENAKSLALWGIMAFVIILSLWGIVNMFVNGFEFGGGPVVTPDYMDGGGGGGNP